MTGEWRFPTTDDLLDAIAALPDREGAANFMRDLCTLRELHDMAQRWQIVQLLDQGRHYGEISRETGASTATVTRIAQWLKHGTGGYRSALERGAGVAARERGGDPASREPVESATARQP
jgi:TrpR-related protein YerC/YecD